VRAVLTVIGTDRVGIIAAVSRILADSNVNILDISQTTMQDIFTMIMLVDISKSTVKFVELTEKLEGMGSDIGLYIKLQHEDIFNSMHRI
jgi:ACT domain-containing protein